jgi:transcriptional regulator with XRE-family HTH domain
VDSLYTSAYDSCMAKEDVRVRFGQRVKELRKSKGLSQEDFALECNLDRTYMSGIERGKRNVSLRNLEVIALTLGIELDELFKGV